MERYTLRSTSGIFTADIFLVTDDIDLASYADSTIYNSNDCVNDVMTPLTKSVKKLCQWFSEKQMKEHIDKYHLILSKKNDIGICVESSIKYTIFEKLLGLESDQYLNLMIIWIHFERKQRVN